MTRRNRLGRSLRAGLVAGVVSAAVNSLYFAAYRAATGIAVREPSLLSIGYSSVLPCLLAALGHLALSRLTNRATTLFVITTAIVTAYSFEGLFRSTLPDGTPKPTGFDGLVMPMHVVVGGAAALLIPLFTRDGRRS